MEENTTPSVFDEMAQQPNFVYATPGQRFANYIIDLVVYYAFNYLVFIMLGICLALSGMDADSIKELFSNKIFDYGIALLNLIIIYTFIEGVTKGRSLGKVITSTKVVKDDYSSTITWKQAFIRSLCRLIPFEPFSAFGGYPWHDQFSKTFVIKKRVI